MLQRNFGFIAIFTFTCTIMGTWGGVLLYYGKTMMKYVEVVIFAF